MKMNDAVFERQLYAVDVAAALSEVSSELQNLCNKLDARAMRRESTRQLQQYGFKPWALGIPTHDVCGNALPFLDAGASIDSRYWVASVQNNGAHIRKTANVHFCAVAPTEAEALALGDCYATVRNLIAPHIAGTQARADGWFVVRYTSHSTR